MSRTGTLKRAIYAVLSEIKLGRQRGLLGASHPICVRAETLERLMTLMTTAGGHRRLREPPRNDRMTELRSHDPVLMQVQTTRGLAKRIAETCGVKREAVWNWKRVPAVHVLAIERLLGISRHQIRPDVFTPPKRRPAKRRGTSDQNGWLRNG